MAQPSFTELKITINMIFDIFKVYLFDFCKYFDILCT